MPVVKSILLIQYATKSIKFTVEKDIMINAFLPSYIKIIAACIGSNFNDNYDFYRFGPLKQKKQLHLKSLLLTLLQARGLIRASTARSTIELALSFVESHVDNFEWLFQHLTDEESRQTLLQVLAFRALGNRRVKLPLNNPAYWSNIKKVAELAELADSIDVGFNNWKAHMTDLSSLGYPIRLYVPLTGPVYAFVLQQYRCQMPNKVIEAEEGDIVIDAGGCWGDTALYFADRVGGTGKVYSFEFMSANTEIFRLNMTFNPELSKRIHLVQQALWSKSGEKLYIEGKGPATCVMSSPSNPLAGQIETLSIDDLVYREGLPRVDFIKMDIEGAELQALKGGEQTIRQYSPKLAISVYHNLHDFWTIPQWIDQLGLGYRFSLRHFTIHQEETVLFAAQYS